MKKRTLTLAAAALAVAISAAAAPATVMGELVIRQGDGGACIHPST